jgi:hypothetical protein
MPLSNLFPMGQWGDSILLDEILTLFVNQEKFLKKDQWHSDPFG